MRNPPHFIRFILALLLSGSALALTACGGGGDTATTASTDATVVPTLAEQLTTIPTASLDATEQAGMLYLREEEKLARDVYITLGAQWSAQIFANISESEQQHMDAVLLLLTRYGLPDPAANNGVGTFTDAHIQETYDALVAQGSTDLIAALTVGATIEDLDIKDLAARIAETDNADLILVYSELTKGSRNHLRAFVSQLTDLGVVYVPQFISQEEFDAIINSDAESGSL